MDILKQLIDDNLSYYPQLKEYDDVVINVIIDYKKERPDIAIEASKWLLEWILKFIYLNLDPNIIDLTWWGDATLGQKFKKIVEILKLNWHEDEFLRQNNPLVQKLGEIRNDRWDISHWQAYPKNSYSTINFTKFIILWTEGICYFLLSIYIDLKQIEKEIGITEYTEDQFEQFDSYLDKKYSFDGILYSKALKDQDPSKYELLMDKFYYDNIN